MVTENVAVVPPILVVDTVAPSRVNATCPVGALFPGFVTERVAVTVIVAPDEGL
jgi:hypothetical protein